MRVAFEGFWGGFDPNRNVLASALAARHSFEIVEARDAALLFYSKHGHAHRSFAGTKVFFSAENLRPPWGHADYCIGYDFDDDPRYFRFPYYALLAIEDEDAPLSLPPPPPWEEREFCAFVYSHPATPDRRMLYDLLASYRSVASPGAFLHNVDAPELEGRSGDWRPSKIRYLQRFKFVVASENSLHPGYTTEKIYDALLAGAIPIYWGNPLVDRDFDPRAFITAGDPIDADQLLRRVREADSSAAAAAEYLRHSPGQIVPTKRWRSGLEDFLDGVATAAVAGHHRTQHRVRALRLTTQLQAGRSISHVRHRVRALGWRRSPHR